MTIQPQIAPIPVLLPLLSFLRPSFALILIPNSQGRTGQSLATGGAHAAMVLLGLVAGEDNREA